MEQRQRRAVGGQAADEANNDGGKRQGLFTRAKVWKVSISEDLEFVRSI